MLQSNQGQDQEESETALRCVASSRPIDPYLSEVIKEKEEEREIEAEKELEPPVKFKGKFILQDCDEDKNEIFPVFNIVSASWNAGKANDLSDRTATLLMKPASKFVWKNDFNLGGTLVVKAKGGWMMKRGTDQKTRKNLGTFELPLDGSILGSFWINWERDQEELSLEVPIGTFDSADLRRLNIQIKASSSYESKDKVIACTRASYLTVPNLDAILPESFQNQPDGNTVDRIKAPCFKKRKGETCKLDYGERSPEGKFSKYEYEGTCVLLDGNDRLMCVPDDDQMPVDQNGDTDNANTENTTDTGLDEAEQEHSPPFPLSPEARIITEKFREAKRVPNRY